jgi:hypothetical protein
VISSLPVFEFQRALINALYESIKCDSQYSLEFYLTLSFHHLFYNAELKNEVRLVIGKNTHFAQYQNYKLRGITPTNFTFQSLIEAIKPTQLLQILKLLLLEKKIILIRDSCDDNAVLIESLITLLSPL